MYSSILLIVFIYKLSTPRKIKIIKIKRETEREAMLEWKARAGGMNWTKTRSTVMWTPSTCCCRAPLHIHGPQHTHTFTPTQMYTHIQQQRPLPNRKLGKWIFLPSFLARGWPTTPHPTPPSPIIYFLFSFFFFWKKNPQKGNMQKKIILI